MGKSVFTKKSGSRPAGFEPAALNTGKFSVVLLPFGPLAVPALNIAPVWGEVKEVFDGQIEFVKTGSPPVL